MSISSAERAPAGASPPFQDSDHPLAGYLRHDTQRAIGDPGLATTELPSPPDPLEALPARPC